MTLPPENYNLKAETATLGSWGSSGLPFCLKRALQNPLAHGVGRLILVAHRGDADQGS
jgi:hypothetical protein